METGEHRPEVVFVDAGAITAVGSGTDVLQQAVRDNRRGLRSYAPFADRGYQTDLVGKVPDDVLDRVTADHSEHRDAVAFALANSAAQQVRVKQGRLLQQIPPDRQGMVLSTTKADIAALERLHAGEPCSQAAARHILPGQLLRDLARANDVCGPTQCVSAACISGLMALQQGALMIRRGNADLVWVVGVDLASHFVMRGFTSLKSLDPEGCRPFDAARVGLSLGEGAGCVLLAAEELAPSPRVRVRGWGTSNDANHLTGPSRDGSGLALAIHRALGRADLPPEAIGFLSAHGTGTPYNDAMESLAFQTVFGSGPPPFSSHKGLLGHTLGAAGILETILCVTAIRSGILPGTPGLGQRDPVAPDSVLFKPQPIAGPCHLLKVNCGFGGTNAALVLTLEVA